MSSERGVKASFDLYVSALGVGGNQAPRYLKDIREYCKKNPHLQAIVAKSLKEIIDMLEKQPTSGVQQKLIVLKTLQQEFPYVAPVVSEEIAPLAKKKPKFFSVMQGFFSRKKKNKTEIDRAMKDIQRSFRGWFNAKRFTKSLLQLLEASQTVGAIDAYKKTKSIRGNLAAQDKVEIFYDVLSKKFQTMDETELKKIYHAFCKSACLNFRQAVVFYQDFATFYDSHGRMSGNSTESETVAIQAGMGELASCLENFSAALESRLVGKITPYAGKISFVSQQEQMTLNSPQAVEEKEKQHVIPKNKRALFHYIKQVYQKMSAPLSSARMSRNLSQTI